MSDKMVWVPGEQAERDFDEAIDTIKDELSDLSQETAMPAALVFALGQIVGQLTTVQVRWQDAVEARRPRLAKLAKQAHPAPPRKRGRPPKPTPPALPPATTASAPSDEPPSTM